MSLPSWRRPHGQLPGRSKTSVFEVKHGSWRSKKETDDITDPEIVGYFSLDGNRTYLPNSSNLSYYISPETTTVNFNLDEGIESVCRKLSSADDERIDNLLRWIKLNFASIQAPVDTKKWILPDFVCFRGLLTVLFCTPYSPRDAWIIYAAKWKGTIYLCAFKTPEEKRRNANMSKDMLKFMSWGFKFEKYILSDSPDVPPDPLQPVNEAEEFCCMFRRRFGDHTVLYGAEMDGVKSETKLVEPLPLRELKFVELKTNRVIEHTGQDRNFRKFKLLKWWSQSFLVGVESILCGFRDDEGIVRDLINYSLPEIVDMSKTHWNSTTCINFCQAFLSHVSKTVVLNCDKIIYKFERVPFEDIVTTEVSPTSEYAFVPSLFMEETG